MGRSKMGRSKLDYYIDFLENSNEANLTIEQLNEIIYMHGFRKVHRRPKKVVTEAVNSIDLVIPFRSTLSLLGSSSSAFLSREELGQDLRMLQWNEGSVQSVETLGLEKLSKERNADPSPSVRKWGSKRKRGSKKVNSLGIASCPALGVLPSLGVTSCPALGVIPSLDVASCPTLGVMPGSYCASHRSFKRGH